MIPLHYTTRAGKMQGFFAARVCSESTHPGASAFTLRIYLKFLLTCRPSYGIIRIVHAGMMELADVLDSKSSGSDTVRVRPPLPAPSRYNPNRIFLIGDGFGLFVFFEKFEDTHFRNGVVKRPESKPRGPRKPKLSKDKEDN